MTPDQMNAVLEIIPAIRHNRNPSEASDLATSLLGSCDDAVPLLNAFYDAIQDDVADGISLVHERLPQKLYSIGSWSHGYFMVLDTARNVARLVGEEDDGIQDPDVLTWFGCDIYGHTEKEMLPSDAFDFFLMMTNDSVIQSTPTCDLHADLVPSFLDPIPSYSGHHLMAAFAPETWRPNEIIQFYDYAARAATLLGLGFSHAITKAYIYMSAMRAASIAKQYEHAPPEDVIALCARHRLVLIRSSPDDRLAWVPLSVGSVGSTVVPLGDSDGNRPTGTASDANDSNDMPTPSNGSNGSM